MLLAREFFDVTHRCITYVYNAAWHEQYYINFINMLICVIALLLSLAGAQNLYNHNTMGYRNQTWMSTLDNGVPIRQLSIPGTHSSMSTGTWGDAFQTQASSLRIQLEAGVRALDIRCRHYQNSFTIHERLVYLNTDLAGVLNTVKTFLQDYPSQTVLMHIVEEYKPSGNTLSFEEVFVNYKNAFSSLIWIPTTQNPSLGMVRGKVVIIQNFAGAVHGLLYGSFTSIEHKEYSTNWDQHDRWINIKNFISATDPAGNSRISFWTGSVGSFPYFCASGKSSPQNGAPRLATGLTTPGFKKYYPDFPRVACFIGICTIAFEGINILGFNHIQNNGFKYLGIVFTDFAGDSLLQTIVEKNGQLFGKCTSAQTAVGCSSCSTTGDCLSCEETLHYVYDPTTKSCIAELGYFLNPTQIPQKCSLAMIGCLQCQSGTICTLCDVFLNYELVNGTCNAAPGYFLDPVTLIPVKCNILGCYLCSSATVCTACSAATNFISDGADACICDNPNNFTLFAPLSVCVCNPGLFLSPNNTCEPIPRCPANNSGCLSCNIDVCEICDVAAGFQLDSPFCMCQPGQYFDGVTCSYCNATNLPCALCLSSLVCTVCDMNFTLVEGVCECKPQYYSHDADTCLQCTPGCLSCTGPAACTICDANASFLLVGGMCQCQVGKFLDLAVHGETCVPCGAMTGCVDCNMNGCIACDALFGFSLDAASQCVCEFGFYVSAMAVCTQCRMEGCLDCDTASTCEVCENGTYYLDADSKKCLETCGDGVVYSLECDDGNQLNGDGCSSECKVEQYFNCSGGSASTPSACSYAGPVNLSLISYVKSATENKVTIRMKFYPSIPLFTTVNYEQAIVPSFPISSRETIYDPTSGEINFVFNYQKSLNTNSEMEMTFQPPQSLSFFHTSSARLGLPRTTNNNLGLKAYSPEVYNLQPVMDILVYVLLGLGYGGFLFGVIFASKLIAVEMIMVLQVAFLGLITLDKLEAFMYSFVNLWPTTGYNRIGLPDKDNSDLPRRIVVPGYGSWFLANFNTMAAFMVLPFLAGLAVLAYSKAAKSKQWRVKSYKILKQWGLTGLLFVQVHLCSSVGLAVKYGMDQIYGVAIGGLFVLGFVAMGALFIIRPKNFGEYKQFFGKTGVKSNFYIIVILLRFVLASVIPVLNENKFSLIVGIATIGLLTIYIVVFQPYNHNLRPIFNGLVIAATLAVYLNYNLTIIDETQWLTTYIPLILVIVLILCVVANILLMIRHRFCNPVEAEKVKRDEYLDQIDESFDNEAKKAIQMNAMMTPRITAPLNRDVSVNSSVTLLKDIRKEIYMKETPNNFSNYIHEYEAI